MKKVVCFSCSIAVSRTVFFCLFEDYVIRSLVWFYICLVYWVMEI